MNSFCAFFFPKQKSTRRKQCFVFHDVDLLPLNAQNLYACSNLPIHLSAFVDTFRFNLPYSTLFGGALAISQEIFEAVNGFSNQFSGWGGEDDDFWLNRHSDPKSIIQFVKSAYSGPLSSTFLITKPQSKVAYFHDFLSNPLEVLCNLELEFDHLIIQCKLYKLSVDHIKCKTGFGFY